MSMRGVLFLLTFTVLTLFLTLTHVRAATVQIYASDPSAIQYSPDWVGPTTFQLIPGVDDVSAAGPNSSVCSIPEVSVYSGTDGESFSFSFHGIAVQLVLSSRPDHAPFGVSIDGGPEEHRDSYSVGARCGVAWSREGLSLGNHTVRATVHTQPPRIFLELLSILYDDGSDIVVPPPTPSSGPTPSASARLRTFTTTPPTSPSSLVLSSSAFVSMSSSSSSADNSSPNSSALLSTASTRNTAAQSSSLRGPLPRGAVIGMATLCAGLGALLGLMVLVLLWRRRRVRRAWGSYLLPYPTSTTSSGSCTSASSVAVEKSLKPPTAQSRAVLPNGDVTLPTDATGTTTTSTPSRSSAPVTGTLMEPEAMRLAPEDIDRIAARMHDVLTTAHARLGGSDATALPPY